MIYCLAAKVFLSITGFGASFIFWESLSIYLASFFVGILPVWGEVAASALLKYEPARESVPSLLFLDALADALVFLWIPSAWFYFTFDLEPFSLLSFSLGFFIVCGLFRLQKFLRHGLSEEGYFQGLPVTYTGYLWIVLCALKKWNLDIVVMGGLVFVGVLMILNKKFIKASR